MATVLRSHRVFTRFFNGNQSNILNYCADLGSAGARRLTPVNIAMDVLLTPRNAPPTATCDSTMVVHPAA